MTEAPPRPTWWRYWLIAPVVAQLRQGITPEHIALTIALATTLGVFPILGATTLLCVLVAARLRLNQPLMQLANYLIYPLQLALLLPFYRTGETLFGQPHVPILSIAQLASRFRLDPRQFFIDYGMVGVYGVAVWMLVAPLMAGLIYFALRPLLQRIALRSALSRAA
jgi:uncharacterized protein (DUF2062 family)